MSKFKLQRTKQCAKCPWKVGINPHEIPDGYCETKHKNLKETIAEEGSLNFLGKDMKVMACHHSDNDNMQYCIGWLNQQLGVGNNIGLRFKMMNCENINDIQVYGEQHKRFEDTLPNNQ